MTDVATTITAITSTAVVAVDDLGNLKAAARWAVPIDVLPAQTSRDDEDCAAAMAGTITMDPLTLHIDCAGTIATINWARCKALGAGGARAHVWSSWSRLLCSHGEVRALKVKRPATQRDVEAWRFSGNDFANAFAKKGTDTHKPAFRAAKTVVACDSFAKQAARWAAEAHVMLRSRAGTTRKRLRQDQG